MSSLPDLRVRPSEVADLDFFFALQQDPEAVWMAAFTSENLSDRDVFDARWRRVLADPAVTVLTVSVEGQPVGQVLHFAAEGRREVSYWIAREHWGRGYATQALRLLLDELTERPAYARAAQDNAGSLAVLRRNGFDVIGVDAGWAAGRGEVVAEYLLICTG